MPSFNQTQLEYNVRNANAVQVMLGDIVIAYAQTTNPTINYGTEQLYGVGNSAPQEVQQLRISPEITVDAFELTSKGRTVLGYPSSYDQILSNNQFDIHLMNAAGVTDSTYVGCVASSFGKNISTNAPITDSIVFLAMDVLDQNGQSVLGGQNAFNVGFLTGVNA